MPFSAGLRSTRLGLLLLGLLLGCASLTARGDELSQLQALVAKHPDNPQYRLRQALVLQGLHRNAQAEQVLRKLIEQYPELPEPYNNLAVLYASEGRPELAREQLELALKANPAYTTARANLGDVYLELARRSYQLALRSGGDAAAAAHARAELQRLDAPHAGAPRTPATAASPPPASVPPASVPAAPTPHLSD